MLYLFYMYQLLYETMYVGTSEKGVSFYQQLGFQYDRTLAGFFTQHYPEPVYEDVYKRQGLPWAVVSEAADIRRL